MKVSPIIVVTGIRIELTIDEALRIAQDQKSAGRVREEIRVMLNGSGVDPDTGQNKPSLLGLKTDHGQKVLPDIESQTPRKIHRCPICSQVAKTARGLAVHISRMHKEFSD